VLSDFFVDAHAAVGHCPLLKRDVQRYRATFLPFELIPPSERARRLGGDAGRS